MHIKLEKPRLALTLKNNFTLAQLLAKVYQENGTVTEAEINTAILSGEKLMREMHSFCTKNGIYSKTIKEALLASGEFSELHFALLKEIVEKYARDFSTESIYCFIGKYAVSTIEKLNKHKDRNTFITLGLHGIPLCITEKIINAGTKPLDLKNLDAEIKNRLIKLIDDVTYRLGTKEVGTIIQILAKSISTQLPLTCAFVSENPNSAILEKGDFIKWIDKIVIPKLGNYLAKAQLKLAGFFSFITVDKELTNRKIRKVCALIEAVKSAKNYEEVQALVDNAKTSNNADEKERHVWRPAFFSRFHAITRNGLNDALTVCENENKTATAAVLARRASALSLPSDRSVRQ